MQSRASALLLRIVAIVALMAMGLTPTLSVAAQESCDPKLTIETPTEGADAQSTLTVWGYAYDQSVSGGSGISRVQIVLDGELDQGGIVLGMAERESRPDIDSSLGRVDTFGFSYVIDLTNVSTGTHWVYVYAYTLCGPVLTYVSANVIAAPPAEAPVVVAPAPPPPPPPPPPVTTDMFVVDTPAGAVSITNGSPLPINGWTAGPSVEVYLDGPRGQGTSVGATSANKPRPDVAQATGNPNLSNSGYDFPWTVTGISTGSHTVYVQSQINGEWATRTFSLTIRSGSTSTTTAGTGTGPQVKIESPPSGTTVYGNESMRGYAVDCTNGQPARQVRILRGSSSGTLLGTATLSNSQRDLSTVCSGLTGSAPINWTYALDVYGNESSATYVAVADFVNSTGQGTVSLTLSSSGGYNYGSGSGSGNCPAGYYYSGNSCVYGSGGSGNCGTGGYWNGNQCVYGSGGSGNCGTGGYWNGNSCVYGSGTGTGYCQYNNGYYYGQNGQAYANYQQCIASTGGGGTAYCQYNNGYYYGQNGQAYTNYQQCIAVTGGGTAIYCQLNNGYYYGQNGQAYTNYQQCIASTGTGYCTYNNGYYYNQYNQSFTTYQQCINSTGTGGTGYCTYNNGYYYNQSGQSFTNQQQCYSSTGTGNYCGVNQYWNGYQCVSGSSGSSGNCAYGYYWNGYQCLYSGTSGNCQSGSYWNGSQCVYGGGSGTNCQWNGNGYYNLYNLQSYPTQQACYNAAGGTSGVNCAQSGNYFYNTHNYQWYNTYNDCIAAG